MRFFERLLFIVAVGTAILFIAFAYDAVTSDKITLRKDHWECTKTSEVLTPVMIGKMTTLMSLDQCDQWTRKQ